MPPKSRAKKTTRIKKSGKIPAVSHIFQVQLVDTSLSPEQRKRLATKIRSVTAAELLKMDFRIEDITPLFDESDVASNCGGACHA